MADKPKCPGCGKDAQLVLEEGKPKEAFHLYGVRYIWYRCGKCRKRFLIQVKEKE